LSDAEQQARERLEASRRIKIAKISSTEEMPISRIRRSGKKEKASALPLRRTDRLKQEIVAPPALPKPGARAAPAVSRQVARRAT
jgi:hypothetical protein